MIYAFGNSHAHFFTDSHPGELAWGKKRNEHFASYSGNFHNPQYRHVLVHKFGERFFPYFIGPINSINFTENDYIMFIVGEIDCRWHFPKRIKTQNRSIEDVLREDLETHFFPSFLSLKENGYQVVGWGGHASTTGPHNDDPDNPVYGDCLFRNEISIVWSNMFEEKCRQHEMKFVSIIKDLIAPDGLTKMEYMRDYCHLNESAYPLVIKQCRKEGIIT